MNIETKPVWDYSELLEEVRDRIEEKIAMEGGDFDETNSK